MNIFEKATRNKLRFTTTRGEIGVEQLWDLPLKGSDKQITLNSVAVELKNTLSVDNSIDLVDGDDKSTSKEYSLNKLRFDIVMHIIGVRKKERDERIEEESRRSQVKRIDEIIASKEMDEMQSKSIDELKALRNNLS